MGSSGGTTLVMIKMQSSSSFDFSNSRPIPMAGQYAQRKREENSHL